MSFENYNLSDSAINQINFRARAIAIYLPQFHPIPENDAAWGKGFTEWRNVVNAKPLFKGHYQPHLPADLGYYDLRLPEVRQAQADLAKEYGIYGFCYYHYWFNGKRVLERPFQEVFDCGKPDFPFMLCWANENWTRVWDGGSNEIIFQQTYGEEDARSHIRTLIPYFKDKRYIRIEDKPVMAIYRSVLIPDLNGMINIWREEAAREGLELYLCRFDNFGCHGNEFMKPGFDAAIDFEPYSQILTNYLKRKSSSKNNFMHRATNKIRRIVANEINPIKKMQNKNKHILDPIEYNDYVDFYIDNYIQPEHFVRFPGVCPSWDNTPRRGINSFLLKNASPDKYKRWLEFTLSNFKPYSEDQNFIFINAWNEWAEGNHLEPCQKWGHSYLKATYETLCGANL